MGAGCVCAGIGLGFYADAIGTALKSTPQMTTVTSVF